MKTLCLLILGASFSYAGDIHFGKPLTQAAPIPIEKLTGQPERYIGKTVQVKGKITEVCQMMGCWMQLVDPDSGKAVRVKVSDGEIAFPKDSAGKTAVAEGKWTKIELNREQALARARHEAEEQGRPFRPASVKGPAVIYQIQGTGAVVYDAP